MFSHLFVGGQHGHVQPFSDEDASIETLSHCSSFSDITSVADEGRLVCACASVALLPSSKHVSPLASLSWVWLHGPVFAASVHSIQSAADPVFRVPVTLIGAVRRVSIYYILSLFQVERLVRTRPRRISSTS